MEMAMAMEVQLADQAVIEGEKNIFSFRLI